MYSTSQNRTQWRRNSSKNRTGLKSIIFVHYFAFLLRYTEKVVYKKYEDQTTFVIICRGYASIFAMLNNIKISENQSNAKKNFGRQYFLVFSIFSYSKYIYFFHRNYPKSQEEWTQLLQQQRQLHESEIDRWKEIIATSIDLIDQVRTADSSFL